MDGASRSKGKILIPSSQPHPIREIRLQSKQPFVQRLFC